MRCIQLRKPPQQASVLSNRGRLASVAPMKTVVVAAFVMMDAVGFLAYRAFHSPDAVASSLPTSKHEPADTVSRHADASQAKPVDPPVAAQPTPEPHVVTPAVPAQPTVPENTNSPREEATQPAHETAVQRTRVKRPVRKHTGRCAREASSDRRGARGRHQARCRDEGRRRDEARGRDEPAETKPADKARRTKFDPRHGSETVQAR